MRKINPISLSNVSKIKMSEQTTLESLLEMGFDRNRA